MRETTNFFEIKVVSTVNIVKKKVFNVGNDEIRLNRNFAKFMDIR